MELIIFPYHDWKKVNTEGARGRDTHLIKGFLNSDQIDRVLIFNRPMSLSEKIFKKEKKFPNYPRGIVVKKEKNYQISIINNKLYVVDFYVNDFIGPILSKRAWWANVLVNQNIKNLYEKIIAEYTKNPIYISFNPFASKVLELLKPERFIYDVFDDFSQHPRFSKKEKEIAAQGFLLQVKKANYIIKVSEDYDLVKYNSNVDLIKNGFPSYFLQDAEIDKVQLSNKETLAFSANSIVGYSGRIGKRLDVNLINQIAEELPDTNFVFIGEIYDENWIKRLKEKKNIYFIGKKYNEELPQYFDLFDVAIVPHHVSHFESGGNSIKIYEYISRGLPVVTTAIGGHSEIISNKVCVSSNENFSSTINDLLKLKSNTTKIDNEYLKPFVWDSKVENYIKVIKQV
ncbi:glycosyltransferase [Jeotgalibacillus campisalis]|uniref:Glycosyl transferase family 1 domain-containing protein n=1 Tax=Jeotgalibacillus campisalis TaxID=220754 RepID=A0A0C2QYP6_9BACL|nr:glycosyltransferase [Jeotgalibacillus campisalis]KIL43160.1 hypothetical protein KR50_35630 [Jeotgalibacillus campisalis]